MPYILRNVAEIDDRIAAARENLRELIEQAAAYSGAADEDLMSQRIAEQPNRRRRVRSQHFIHRVRRQRVCSHNV
jgi:hypothetical protein